MADCGCLNRLTGGGVSGSHPAPDAPIMQVGPATGKEFNTLRAELTPVACWRVDDIRFAFDSSLVHPSIAAELLHLSELLQLRLPPSKAPDGLGCPLSLFGHADPVGDDTYNKHLSGRRAASIYGLLTRDVGVWERLYGHALGNDNWGDPALQMMLNTVSPDSNGGADAVASYRQSAAERRDLYRRYMDKLCTPELKLEKRDFLGQGGDSGGKADYQGCSEFNPLLIFSDSDQQRYAQASDKSERNTANAPNRRVLALIFRPGSKVDPARWPCPAASDGVEGCKKRFFSDGEQRRSRSLPDQTRSYTETKDTFACRFYQRLLINSPCEAPNMARVFRYGLEIGADMPWSDQAVITIASQDNAQQTTYTEVLGVRIGTQVVFTFPNVLPGVSYRGFIKDNQRDVELFTYTELARLLDKNDPLNCLLQSNPDYSGGSLPPETPPSFPVPQQDLLAEDMVNNALQGPATFSD